MKDLIIEAGKSAKSDNKTNLSKKFNVSLENFTVDKKKKDGFEKGKYAIVSTPLLYLFENDCHLYVSKVIKKELEKMLKSEGVGSAKRCLIVGLGNPLILGDCLGSKSVEKIQINPFKQNNQTFKIAPNVFSSTGIDTYEIIHMLTLWLDVDFVVIIDSLGTECVERLGKSFQINSAGLTPGSALHKFGKPISKETLKVPCFAIGVPNVYCHNKDVVLTAKDVHEQVETQSKIISYAIMGVLVDKETD